MPTPFRFFGFGKATISNLQQTDQPFIWDYSFQAANYAKFAGNLLLVRPRVLGSKSSGLLEASEPHRYPIEFPGPCGTRIARNHPALRLRGGRLPPAIDADYPFASYHAKTEVTGNVLHYRRTFEVRGTSVPVSEAAELRKFYRIIATDERNSAVLKLP